MKNILFAVVLLLAVCNPLQAQYLNSGYRGMAEFGSGLGTPRIRSDYTPSSRPLGFHVELSTTHGYQFNPYLFLGGGVSMLARSFTDDGCTFPFFADFRANFNKKRRTPYGALKIGYSVNAEKELNGGIYINPSFGYRFGIHKKMAATVSLGYLFEQVDYYKEGGLFCLFFCSPRSIARADLSAYTLKVGLEF